jgi:hypothetical protein
MQGDFSGLERGWFTAENARRRLFDAGYGEARKERREKHKTG